MTFRKQLYEDLFNAKLLNRTKCTKEEAENFSKMKDDELPDNIIVAYEGKGKEYYSCGIPTYDNDTSKLIELEKLRLLKSIKSSTSILATLAIIGVIVGVIAILATILH